MHPLVKQNQPGIAKLCRHYGVRQLALFGSALRDDFDPMRSDVDVTVEFAPAALGTGFDRYLGLKEGLEKLFGRPVDVIELHALSNQRLRRHIEARQVPLYAAA